MLALALQSTRDYVLPRLCPDGPLPVWADQICINQSDLPERGAQVKAMRDVYGNARATVVHLAADRQGERGFRFLRAIAIKITELDDDDPSVEINKVTDWVIKQITKTRGSEEWIAMCKIFKAPWWLRAWTYQEAVASRDIFFLYGKVLLSKDCLIMASEVLSAVSQQLGILLARSLISKQTVDSQILHGRSHKYFHDLFEQLPENYHREFIRSFAENTEGEEGKHTGLRELLKISRNRDATDLRDKVYAFIGLSDPKYGIEPDYGPGNTLVHTFTDATAAIIRKEDSLDVLFDAIEENRTPGLPTWVPDWSQRELGESLLDAERMAQTQDFRPCKTGPANLQFRNAEPPHYGPVLKIDVLNIGTLSDGSSSFIHLHRDSPGNFLESCENIAGVQINDNPDDPQQFDRLGNSYVTGGSVTTAYLSLLRVISHFDPEGNGICNLNGMEPNVQAAHQQISTHPDWVFGDIQRGDWSFFKNSAGYLGITTSAARFSDYLCLAKGASLPLVLRRCEEGYQFIGGAYVYGLSSPESLRVLCASDTKWEVQTVDIV